jgi:hypothetical protein
MLNTKPQHDGRPISENARPRGTVYRPAELNLMLSRYERLYTAKYQCNGTFGNLFINDVVTEFSAKPRILYIGPHFRA